MYLIEKHCFLIVFFLTFIGIFVISILSSSGLSCSNSSLEVSVIYLAKKIISIFESKYTYRKKSFNWILKFLRTINKHWFLLIISTLSRCQTKDYQRNKCLGESSNFQKNMYLIDEPVLRSAIHAIWAWDWVMNYETKQIF